MNHQTTTLIILIALIAATLTACTPDSALRDIGARNNCNTPIQVEYDRIVENIGFKRKDVEPGTTRYLNTAGDISAIHARVGPVLDDPEARLDETLPVLTYEPNELQIATPEEEQQDDYEYYFTIEDDLCP